MSEKVYPTLVDAICAASDMVACDKGDIWVHRKVEGAEAKHVNHENCWCQPVCVPYGDDINFVILAKEAEDSSKCPLSFKSPECQYWNKATEQ